jgi:hypothetical protein
MQQRLIEAGLAFLRHQQHPKFRFGEGVRQFLFLEPAVHLHFGVGFLRNLIVLDRAGEGHQALDRVALLRDVAVELLLATHRLQPRAGHHHRLGMPADLVPGEVLEVLDHHLGLLADGVRMQVHEAGQRLGGFLVLDVGVVLGPLDQLVVGLVGDVALPTRPIQPFPAPCGAAPRRPARP